MKLAEFWEEVDEEVSKDGGLSLGNLKLVRTGITNGLGEILVGTDARDGRHVLFPMEGTSKEKKDDSTRGVRIEVKELFKSDGTKDTFCDVSCRIPEFNSLFSMVAEDMVEIVSGGNARDAYDQCVNVLDRWRELLDEPSDKTLSKNELAGLLGELWVVRKLADHDSAPLTTWSGPEGAKHDFTSATIDLEIKTSTRQNDRIIQIQSLDQLTSNSDEFYVQYLKIHPSGDEGTSVPELIGELVEKGVERAAIYKKLTKLGYRPEHEEAYRRVKFDVIESLVFRADDPEFPRLTESHFSGGRPECVRDITYKVDLDCAEIDSLSDGDVDVIYSRLANQ
jgi:hypothetical protein